MVEENFFALNGIKDPAYKRNISPFFGSIARYVHEIVQKT